MRLKDKIANYFMEKKHPIKEETFDLIKIGADLRGLMKTEDVERMTAIFFENYSADIYQVLPYEKLLNLSFGYNDDLAMVGKMLIDCAKAKHEQKIKNSQDEIADKPYSVMLYDAESKRIVGGLTVYQEGPNPVACVINERERQKQIQAIREGKTM